jgi:hypothetical protein
MTIKALKSTLSEIIWFTIHPSYLAKVIQSARILYAILEHGGRMSERHRKDLVEGLGKALGPAAGEPTDRAIIALVAQGR